MAIAIFRGTPRDDIDHEDLEKHEEKMMALGTAMLEPRIMVTDCFSDFPCLVGI
jgi:hypothetical protein